MGCESVVFSIFHVLISFPVYLFPLGCVWLRCRGVIICVIHARISGIANFGDVWACKYWFRIPGWWHLYYPTDVQTTCTNCFVYLHQYLYTFVGLPALQHVNTGQRCPFTVISRQDWESSSHGRKIHHVAEKNQTIEGAPHKLKQNSDLKNFSGKHQCNSVASTANTDERRCELKSRSPSDTEAVSEHPAVNRDHNISVTVDGREQLRPNTQEFTWMNEDFL